MDLKHILLLIKRWFWVILIGAIIGAAGGYFFDSRRAPVYQATTRFVILKAAPTSLDYYYFSDDNQELMSTYVQLLTTESLLNEASAQLGYEVKKGQATAQQISNTQFGTVTVKDENPEHSAAIANALIDILIQQNNILQSIRYQTAERNLQDRIDEAKASIEQVQEQLTTLSYTTVQTQLTEVQQRIDELENQITPIESRILELSLLPSLTEAQAIELANYQADLNQIKPILDLYLEIYTNLIVMGTPVESGSDSNIQMEQLKTTLYLYQEIYIASVSDMEALRLARAQSTPTVVQVEPAVVPEKPISPKPLQTASLAGAVGLLLMAGIAFLIEYLDDTIKTPEEVREILGLPVIGLVADMQNSRHPVKQNQTGTFVVKQPRSPISEAFRSLRTNLEFTSVDNPLRSILVTSANPAEGKTTIAANLAFILAQNDRKVLLIDADLRKPKLHQQLGIPNRIGLSDLIRGTLPIEAVLQFSHDNKSLHVITSGSLPPNPAELLGSKRMSQLFSELINNYDAVIIDSPPLLVSDSQILSRLVDGLIFVIKPGKSRIVNLKPPIEELKSFGANLLGVVFNKIPRNRNYYYGGYSYYSSYGKKAE